MIPKLTIPIPELALTSLRKLIMQHACAAVCFRLPYVFSYFSLHTCSPGTSITSDWFSSTSATNTISGTSMATPFGTGVAALYLERDPTMTADAVKKAMQADGFSGVVKNCGANTLNILLSTANLASVSTAPTPAAGPVQAPVPAPAPAPAPVKIPSASTPACVYFMAACTSNKNCCSGRCSRWKACLPF